VGHHHTQDTRRRQIKQNTISGEHKTLRRRHKKNPTQYVLNTTIHKTQDEDKQTKNTTQYLLNTRHKTKTHKTKQKAQHKMCWTPSYV
jgi:CRISPR/Cas system-associated endonuclease/helicase Cas3